MTMPSRYQQLHNIGLRNLAEIHHNLTTEELHAHAIANGEAQATSNGALVAYTGKHTGRAPNDRFIVHEPKTQDRIDWGKVNQPFEPDAFGWLYQKAERYFQGKSVYVQDCYAGADPHTRLKVRVITATAWHNLFARNMFIVPPDEELASFKPDYTVIHVPGLQADPAIDKTRSEAFVLLHLSKRMVLIGGTHYAGEIKKSIFSVMNYHLPEQGILPMHCSANAGENGDVAVFFGLSGTGKTTLSADARRVLIGDDEHGWDDAGVFNFEGGCYAKTIHLSPEGEPEIYATTQRFGTILENVVMNDDTGHPDFDDDTITENTRCSYPIDFIPNASQTGRAGHPQNIIFLTADAFGVLPPVSKLTPEQAVQYFLNGYTAKVAGTEAHVKEPQATFSACFGAPFMPLHPTIYAQMLQQRIQTHNVDVWLVNTGWTGGAYGEGERIALKHTRAIVDAILDGTLKKQDYDVEPYFGLSIPAKCPDVPERVLNPRNTWADANAYEVQALSLARRFQQNYEQYTTYPQVAD